MALLFGRLPCARGQESTGFLGDGGCDHFLLGSQKVWVLCCIAGSICVCVTSAYYHSGGHMISAFVYECAYETDSWNCVLLSCIACAEAFLGSWLKVCYLVFLWYCIEVTALCVTLSWRNLSIVWWQCPCFCLVYCVC